jgi:hypothetical protein
MSASIQGFRRTRSSGVARRLRRRMPLPSDDGVAGATGAVRVVVVVQLHLERLHLYQPCPTGKKRKAPRRVPSKLNADLPTTTVSIAVVTVQGVCLRRIAASPSPLAPHDLPQSSFNGRAQLHHAQLEAPARAGGHGTILTRSEQRQPIGPVLPMIAARFLDETKPMTFEQIVAVLVLRSNQGPHGWRRIS